MGNPVTEGYATTEPLNLDIDLLNIIEGVKNWEQVVDAVQRGYNLGLQELAEKLHQKVLEKLGEYDLADSGIASTISIGLQGDGLVINVGSDYAVYVEYGTGVVGAENPHPHPWQYDVNEHGDEGWWYPTTSADPNKKKRVNKDTGELWAWTKGQRSRPFMYESWLWARRSLTQIMRKNIRNEIKKVKGVR